VRIAFGWYRAFLQALLDGSHDTWFAKLIVAGEILMGVALILGMSFRPNFPLSHAAFCPQTMYRKPSSNSS
jgi:hypothetical protein